MRSTLRRACATLLALAVPTLASAGSPGPNSTVIPSTSQNLSIIISAPPDNSLIPIPPGTALVTGNCAIGTVPGQPINVVYVVDLSGSTDRDFMTVNGIAYVDADGDSVGSFAVPDAGDDFNGDGEAGETLDGEIAGVIALNASIGNPSNVRIGIVGFASNASRADMGPGVGSQVFVSPPQADVSANLQADVVDVLRSLRSEHPTGGSIGQFTAIGAGTLGNNTNFPNAIAAANAALALFPAGTNIVFFLSDGQSNAGARCFQGDCVPQLAAANSASTKINTVGVGASADPVDLAYIAAQTGGTALIVTNPGTLAAVLPTITPSGLDHATVDGNPVGLDALGNFSYLVSCADLDPFTVTATCFASDPDDTEVSATVDLQCYYLCGDGQVGAGEECDPPNTPSCDASCQRIPSCGDTFIDAPEECEPPNGPNCDASCLLIACGNGIVQPGEECEPPSTLTCDASCQRVPSCGDSLVDAPETCDPPDGTTCDVDCTLFECGNGQVEPGEQCEPPSTFTCTAFCQRVPICGDGFVDEGEQCEPPGTATCDVDCTDIVCGNGQVEPAGGEECEPPNTASCSGTCQRVPNCGDTFIDAPEECEPPSTANCDASCLLIACGNGLVQAGEECEPPGTNTCDASCQRVPLCGDTFVDDPETCEPPGSSTCDSDCTAIVCGNGQPEPQGGEECEPPDTAVCDAACQRVPNCGDSFIDAPEQCEPPDTPNCDGSCMLIECGNGLVQPGEECEPPSTATCDATCQRVPVCGDGMLDAPPEQCEPPNTPTCGATCLLQENCTNGIDDDGDNLVDCADVTDCPCPPGQRDPSRIKFDKKGGQKDQLKVHVRITPTTPADPKTEEVAIVLTTADTVIFRGIIPPGLVTGSSSGTSFRFKDKTRTLADGIVKLALKRYANGDWVFSGQAYGNLRAATTPEMSLEFRIGDDAFVVHRRWEEKSNGWLLRDNE